MMSEKLSSNIHFVAYVLLTGSFEKKEGEKKMNFQTFLFRKVLMRNDLLDIYIV